MVGFFGVGVVFIFLDYSGTICWKLLDSFWRNKAALTWLDIMGNSSFNRFVLIDRRICVNKDIFDEFVWFFSRFIERLNYLSSVDEILVLNLIIDCFLRGRSWLTKSIDIQIFEDVSYCNWSFIATVFFWRAFFVCWYLWFHGYHLTTFKSKFLTLNFVVATDDVFGRKGKFSDFLWCF